MAPRARPSPRRRSAAPALTLMLLLAPAGAATQGPSAGSGPDPASAERLYRHACATCHGGDGTGAQPGLLGFEAEVPDFTSCNFATREPDPDWAAVIHAGGPVRAFSPMMPALGEALSQEEIETVLLYVRSLCSEDAWPRGELNLPRPLVTEKAYPEDEAVIATSAAVEGPGSYMNEVVYEHRFGARNQLELVVPFGWRELAAPGALPDGAPGSDWMGGLGDIAIGVKRALYHSLDRGTIFSAAAEVKLPTGDEDRGFGKGTMVLEPFLALGQMLPWESFIQAQGLLEVPVDQDVAENEAAWRAAFGRTFTSGAFGRAWTPMVELLGARALESGAPTHWDMVPQLQVTLNTRQHVMVNVGARVALDEDRPTEVLVYLLWDWFDGGLFDGWRAEP